MPQAEGVHFQRAPGPVVWFSAFAAAGGIKKCGEAATTTLGAEGPVKLKNLKNLRAGGPSTFMPEGVSKGEAALKSIAFILSIV